eukprot:198447-Amorphochlora_amoeboformis.AAC.1
MDHALLRPRRGGRRGAVGAIALAVLVASIAIFSLSSTRTSLSAGVASRGGVHVASRAGDA